MVVGFFLQSSYTKLTTIYKGNKAGWQIYSFYNCPTNLLEALWRRPASFFLTIWQYLLISFLQTSTMYEPDTNKSTCLSKAHCRFKHQSLSFARRVMLSHLISETYWRVHQGAGRIKGIIPFFSWWKNILQITYMKHIFNGNICLIDSQWLLISVLNQLSLCNINLLSTYKALPLPSSTITLFGVQWIFFFIKLSFAQQKYDFLFNRFIILLIL